MFWFGFDIVLACFWCGPGIVWYGVGIVLVWRGIVMAMVSVKLCSGISLALLWYWVGMVLMCFRVVSV